MSWEHDLWGWLSKWGFTRALDLVIERMKHVIHKYTYKSTKKTSYAKAHGM